MIVPSAVAYGRGHLTASVDMLYLQVIDGSKVSETNLTTQIKALEKPIIF